MWEIFAFTFEVLNKEHSKYNLESLSILSTAPKWYIYPIEPSV